jgi:predicted O-methyltransferase YrrM
MLTKINNTRLMLKAVKKQFQDTPLIGVEIGSSIGNNAQVILDDFKNITRLYLIDSFPVCPDFLSAEDQEHNKETLIRRFKDEPKIEIILKDSVEASKQFEDKSVDFVYIDGDHSYDAVKEDIIAWLPKIKINGIIGGHDYDYYSDKDKCRSVKKAVNEIFSGGNTKLGLTLQTIDLEEFFATISCDWWVHE